MMSGYDMTETDCIIRDNDSGLCEYGSVYLADDGTPCDEYGQGVFTHDDGYELLGWGKHDGHVEIWEHESGEFAVLLSVKVSS